MNINELPVQSRFASAAPESTLLHASAGFMQIQDII